MKKNKMTCIVVDDEPLAREGMQYLVNATSCLELAGMFSSVEEADTFLQQNKTDLLFLDIQMPGISGLEYLSLKKQHPQVIITTAFPQYAVQGFELDVTDYLVKPIRTGRFEQAVTKALARLQAAAPAGDSVEMDDNYVFVRADKKFVRVSVPDILYIEGMKDYSAIHFKEGKIIVAINLRTVLLQLPAAHFMRISKSFVINLLQLESLESNFVLVGNERIPIGEQYKEPLMHYIRKVGIISRG